MLPLLLLVALPFSQGEAEDSRPALQEEVNVLVYGILQLGQGLSETYSSTTHKLQRAVGWQKRQERGLERLKGEVTRAREEEQRLRNEMTRLQREEQEVQVFSTMIEGELRNLQRGYKDLQRRVRDLEETMQETELDAQVLKVKTDHQHLILQVIVEAVAQQREQMTKQRVQLNHILQQVSGAGSS